MRQRDAPIAERMLISSDRPAPRASSRLATFAHAISSTSPVTVRRRPAIGSSSLLSEGRTPDEALETSTPRFLFVSG